MDALSNRHTYDEVRLVRYFNHVKLPTDKIPDWHESPERAVMQLHIIQQHQLATVPFENLSLHYSYHRSVNLHPDLLFDKIVNKGHGGYCMENNCFFGTILRSLGFTVYSAGARVHQGSSIYTPWSHMVNIMTLTNGERYLIDVGFGNNGPTCPLLLRDGHETQSIAPASMRLVREKIPPTTNPNDRLWTYQHRVFPDSDWETMYCFTETEFLPQDYEMMNFWTSQSRKSFFTYQIICVKKIMDERNHELVGTLILTGAEVKRRVGEKTEQLKVCKTEGERVEVLDRVFGVKLMDEEKRAIVGLVTQLPMMAS